MELFDPTTWKIIVEGIKSFKDIVDIGKTVRDATKDESKKKELTASIEKAEGALSIGEAQIAKALGYHLCQCTFPPQIMLSKGRHEKRGVEIFACEKCGKQEPSQQHFDELDRNDTVRRDMHRGRGPGSWMGS
jgi:hypothetical protein